MEEEKRNESEISTQAYISNPVPVETAVAETSDKHQRKKQADPVVTGLMFGVSFLCLCIIGVMLYWLTAFLS